MEPCPSLNTPSGRASVVQLIIIRLLRHDKVQANKLKNEHDKKNMK